MIRGIDHIGRWIVVALALGAGPAFAQPALLPVHVLGAATSDEADALARAFVVEVAAISEEPVTLLSGEPCPQPTSCFEPGRSDSYWVQISGDASTRVAVAYRLDGLGDVVARAVAEGAPGQEDLLAVRLAGAVAAGESGGLVVTSGRTRGAAVSLDGTVVGRTPYRSRSPIDSGFHVVQVQTHDGRTAASLVRTHAGAEATLDLDFTAVPRADRRRVGAWPLLPILAGSAVATLLVATDPAGIIGPDYHLTVTGP